MSEEEDNVPEEETKKGLEIRVIGGGAPSGWEENVVDTPAPQPVDDGAGEEDVFRLEGSKGLDVNKTLDDAGPAPVRVQKKRPSGNRVMTLAMMAVVGLSVLGGVAWVIVKGLEEAPPGEEAMMQDLEVERQELDTSLGEMSKKTHEYLDLCQELLRDYLAAGDVEKVQSLLDLSEEGKARLQNQWKPLDLDPEDVASMELAFSEKDDRAWLSLNGRDRNGREVRVVFLPEGEEVVLDWEASFGVGDVPFEKLHSLKPGEEVTMRVMVERDTFFNQPYSEDGYLSFELSPRFEADWVWGYVRRDSPMMIDLRRILDIGSPLMQEKSKVALTLKLKAGNPSGRQFEIVELLNDGWIVWKDQ